jgi:hypothetical protein
MILGIRGIEESSVYQDIFAKGEAEGRAKGEAEGRAKGEAEGRAEEAREAILRLGVRPSIRPCSRMPLGFCWLWPSRPKPNPRRALSPTIHRDAVVATPDLEKIVRQADQLPLGRYLLQSS